MIRTPKPHCNCCGLPASRLPKEDCPRCGYPVNVSKEERFLEATLRDLQRIARYGGANITVAQLISRYQMRLRQLKTGSVFAESSVLPVKKPVLIAPDVQHIASKDGQVEIVATSTPSQRQPVGAVPAQVSQPAPRRVFSLGAFLVDQAITIIGLLGAFLILMGALSSIVTTNNPWLSFLVVFGTHAFFGIAGVIAYRFANARLIARIYTGIYALLVPLVGLNGYGLISSIHLSVPTLIVIASIYAALVYFVLAVYQRFPLFAYLGTVALVVADIGMAQALNLVLWWWPSMLMLLALLALISISPPLRNSTSMRRPFLTGSLAVLVGPIRALTFTLVGICTLGVFFVFWYSFTLNTLSSSSKEVRLAILSMTLLLLLWTCLFFWLSKRTKSVIGIAYLFLTCVLALCYAFDFSQGGYVLALTGVAVLYHGLNRFAPRLLQPFGKLDLYLDELALLLVSIVPFISSLLLPQQLLLRAYHLPVPGNSPLYVQANWTMVAELVTVGMGFLLTLSITFSHANREETSPERQNFWPWLLLLSGCLFTWEYSVVVLALHAEPVWCLLALTVAVVAIAVAVRKLLGARWANPLPWLALSEAVLTIILSLGQSQDKISVLLLTLAVLWYVSAALARVKWWLMPATGFAIGALLLPTNPFWVVVGVSAGAALLSLGISRFAGRDWALPLYIVAVLGVGMTGYTGYYQHYWLATTWALLAFALLAYVIGVIADWDMALWLAPLLATWSVFDAATLLGDLYRPPTVALTCAIIGVGIGLLNLIPLPLLGYVPRNKFLRYALPFYATALAAAVLTGIYGTLAGVNYPFYGAIPDALLVYAVVAYAVLLFERQPRWLGIVAGFAVWGTWLATQTTASYVLGIGLGAGLLGLLIGRVLKQPALDAAPSQGALFRWSWPWYLTMLVAAVEIGLWRSLSAHLPVAGFLRYSLLAFMVLTLVIMLIERIPEMVILVGIWGAWAGIVGHSVLGFAPLMLACSFVCVLIFASQFVWKILPPVTNWLPVSHLYSALSLGGQALIVLIIIGHGGLLDAGLLTFVGAGTLFILALLVFWYGRLQHTPAMQHGWNYGAGFLVSLVISWTVSALGQTNIHVLTLAPATYLLLIAPPLLRSKALLGQYRLGQVVAMLGTALLLLPILWLSFSTSDSNLLYTLILLGEALVLLLLGIGIGVRIFVLSGAGLIVVGTLHALFLPTLGIPTPLALTILGTTLLAIATVLSLLRRRLQIAWAHWE